VFIILINVLQQTWGDAEALREASKGLTTMLIWRLSPTRLEEPAILATGHTIPAAASR
jgi:hypothetical protein